LYFSFLHSFLHLPQYCIFLLVHQFFLPCSYFLNLLLYTIIGNLYLFPLILQKDILSINGLTMILKFIGQCDDKQIMMLPNKNNNISFEILKYIINLITARPIELTHSDTSNNISLNLHNCRFYMYYIISELLIFILQRVHHIHFRHFLKCQSP
jgi:hypothetical protein